MSRCIMALIRGTGGKCPCPICLVPANKLSDLSEKYTLRTAEDTQTILDEAHALVYAEDREDLLKSYAIRNVDVKS